MRSIVLKRLATAIPSLVGVIVISFLLTRVLPGDTASYFAGPAATPQAIAEVRKQLGLDKSLSEQFARYVVDLAHGDLGNSLTTGQPVVTEIANRLPASGELTLLGLLFALGIAVPLGILAAIREGSWIDHLCRVIVTTGVSLPVFFTGLCSSTSSISNSAGRRRRWAVSTSFIARRRKSPASTSSIL